MEHLRWARAARCLRWSGFGRVGLEELSATDFTSPNLKRTTENKIDELQAMNGRN